jgi:lysophospholipase L1-like esterase
MKYFSKLSSALFYTMAVGSFTGYLELSGCLPADEVQNENRSLSQSKSLIDVCQGKEIIAFGDSLTHGYYVVTRWQRYPEFHPYADRLSVLLNNRSDIIRAGVSGEFTSQMVRRLPSVLRDHPNAKLSIILGGTNDLGRRVPINTIIDNLKQLHRL